MGDLVGDDAGSARPPGRIQDRRPSELVSATYEVTYVVNGHLRGAYDDMVERTLDEVAALRTEGIDIEFGGATVRVDDAGRVVAMVARFTAPSQGALGRLNCRAMLPASGVRRLDPGERDPLPAYGRCP